MRRLILVSLIAATGCASEQPVEKAENPPPQQQYYANGEEAFRAVVTPYMTPGLDHIGVPTKLQHDLIDCMWQSFWTRLTPEERTAMDVAARERHISSSLGHDIGKKIDEMKAGGIPLLQQYRPDTISAIKAYDH